MPSFRQKSFDAEIGRGVDPERLKKIRELEKQLEEIKKEEGILEDIEGPKGREKIHAKEEPERPFKKPVKAPKKTKVKDGQKKYAKIGAKLSKTDRKNQIQALVKIALEEGVYEAIQVARYIDNAYVLDEFHDNLVNQLHDELVKKKKIKEV